MSPTFVRQPGPDSLRTVLDSVFAGPAFRWEERVDPFAFLYRWWQTLADWLRDEQATHPDLFWLLFWALIVVFALILVHATWVMIQTFRAAAAPPAGDSEPVTREIHGPAWYRREALELAGEGRYPEAMQADFLGLVLELDARRVLRFHPSKTPSEYTCEAGLGADAREAFRALVRMLYGYAFARRPCGPADFARWRTLTSVERYAGAH